MQLIFIHGAGGSHLNWLLITRKLKNFKIVNIDLPISESIENYEKFFKAILNEDSIIIGHSMGGAVGYYLSVVFDRIKGLVIINSAIFDKFDIDLSKNEICERLYFSKKLIDDCKRRDYLMFKNSQLLKNHLEILNKFDAYKYIEKFLKKNLKAFHIIGENDKLVPIESLLKTSNLLNVIRNYFISECGHMPHIEKPDEVLRILKDIFIYFN
ncbi:MAG: alpha/beta hydrolase [candidate division WOR-3 bacterium]